MFEALVRDDDIHFFSVALKNATTLTTTLRIAEPAICVFDSNRELVACDHKESLISLPTSVKEGGYFVAITREDGNDASYSVSVAW